MKVLTTIILLTIFYTVTPCSGQTQNQKFEFLESRYGIFKSGDREKDGKVSETTIEHSVLDKIELVKKTDRVPAKLGVEFGVEYTLKSKVNETVRLQIEWRYPKEILDPSNGEKIKNIKYDIDLPTNFVNNSNYTLEQDFEVVKGDWELLIYHDNKPIYKRRFVLE
ncbi:MAG: DUF3859 domain-containing protein [Bacteroidetes bacterium]|nr:DUF3859 domain-containing protein [Bacteroidota bacterium]